jgi:predicted alpha/beta-fold hydrolase
LALESSLCCPIADFFLDQNFNVVLYDAPAHGANTARRVSFGYYEKDDLESVVTYIESKMSKDSIIGALGQSMGGSTVAYYSGTEHAKQHLDFAIIDSAFTSMDVAIAWQMNEISPVLPTKLLINMGSISNKLMYGYSFENVSALNSVKMNKIPTLILHSKADQKCPFYMGEELFEAIPHDKKKFVNLITHFI